jgi:hypothetical protein
MLKELKRHPEQSTFKFSKCGTSGDDEGSFKTKNGKVFRIDCLGGEVGFKPTVFLRYNEPCVPADQGFVISKFVNAITNYLV